MLFVQKSRMLSPKLQSDTAYIVYIGYIHSILENIYNYNYIFNVHDCVRFVSATLKHCYHLL